jgi:UDP-glucose 4-epimerase
LTRILVTGGAGYIGSIATHLMLEAGHEVSVLDDLSTGHKDVIDARARFVEGSILDSMSLSAALSNCSAVMHFAGKSLVGESVQKPELYMNVNLDGTAKLLDAMAQAGIKEIVFSSSAATYGQPKDAMISEESPTEPTNPYGLSKLKVDELLASRAASDGIAAISLRYFNVAGALQTSNGWLSERHSPETHLIPNIYKATPSAPLQVFGTDWPTADKTCVRDYVHVVDLIEAHIKALTALKPGTHQIINLGSGRGYSVREVIDSAARVAGKVIPSVDVDRRAGDPAVLIASIEKAKRVLNWSPKRDLNQMMQDVFNSAN